VDTFSELFFSFEKYVPSHLICLLCYSTLFFVVDI